MPNINYFSRDFETLKQDIVNYAKTYHGDIFKYTNQNSPDMLYFEALAYIGDTFNYQIDKAFNESFRDTAQSRESLIRIAQDNGFNEFYAKPSSTQIALKINVPGKSNGSAIEIDSEYLFTIAPGLIVQSTNGSIFECLEEINFSHENNRTIIPNYDSNNVLIDFTVKKTAIVYAGETQIQRFYVSTASSKPFLEIILDSDEVTEVLGVVAKIGNVFDAPLDEEFRANNDNSYVKVDNLSDDKVFVEINPIDNVEVQNILNAYTDMTINYGEWVNKPKRFITRTDKNNITSIIFGSTLVNYSEWTKLLSTNDVGNLTNFSLNQILNNLALGEIPKADTTLFIKFRTGAGVKTNTISNAINSIVQKQIILPNSVPNLTILDNVRNSLIIESSLPAIGGTNVMSNEDLRNSIGKVFASNDRAVTYEDVKALINKMPGKFGQPFRLSYEEIKPALLNYTQIKNYVSTQLTDLLLLQSNSERENKVQEINDFLTNYPTNKIYKTLTGQIIDLATISGAVTNSNETQHQLWFGEKCRLYLLGINSDLQPTTWYKDENNIWRSPNELLKLNIKNYLRDKRLIGDWIDIVDAKVVNIQVEFKIFADKKNKQKVLIDCLTKLRDYFSVYNWYINQPIFKANVVTILQEIEGVINVAEVNFYNIFDKDFETGRQYSPKELGRYKYISSTPVNNQNNKFLMLDFNNVIVSQPDTFLSVKYPEVDIKGSVY